MKTVLFSFEDADQRDIFLGILQKLSTNCVAELSTTGATTARTHEALLVKTLESVRLDPPIKSDDERTGVIYISGQRIIEGPMKDMSKRFDQEVASHSGTVELRELRGGEWKQVRIRRSQI